MQQNQSANTGPGNGNQKPTMVVISEGALMQQMERFKRVSKLPLVADPTSREAEREKLELKNKFGTE